MALASESLLGLACFTLSSCTGLISKRARHVTTGSDAGAAQAVSVALTSPSADLSVPLSTYGLHWLADEAAPGGFRIETFNSIGCTGSALTTDISSADSYTVALSN